MANVLVVYYSRSGNTEKVAQLVAEGVRRNKAHQVQVMRVEEVKVKEFTAADGYAIGSPDYYTYVAGQIKMLFDDLLAESGKIKGKPFVGFVSHGGGGGGLEQLEGLGKAVGLKKVAEGVKSHGAPRTPEETEACRRLGEALGEALS